MVTAVSCSSLNGLARLADCHDCDGFSSAAVRWQVGYGDITPTTALEEMTAVFLMLIGAALPRSHCDLTDVLCCCLYVAEARYASHPAELAVVASSR